MANAQKNETDITTLFKYRAEDRILAEGIKTKVNFICIISLVIFTAVAGQIVLSMSKSRADRRAIACNDLAMLETNKGEL